MGLCPAAFADSVALRHGADGVDMRNVSVYQRSFELDWGHVLGSRSRMLPVVSFRLMKYLEMCFHFQIFINFSNFFLLLFYRLTPVVEGHTRGISALFGVLLLVPGPGTWAVLRRVSRALGSTDRVAGGCGALRPLVRVCRRRRPCWCPVHWFSLTCLHVCWFFCQLSSSIEFFIFVSIP